jgi:hypothetical protein
VANKFTGYSRYERRKARRILRKAISLLNRFGWIRDSYGSEKQGFCLLGGIGEAAADIDTSLFMDNQQLAEDAVEFAIKKRTGKPFDIPKYNDKKARGFRSVKAVLKDGIRYLGTD